MKPFDRVAVPPAVVTAMSTVVPGVPAGDVAVICEAESTVYEAAFVPPKVTAVAPVRLDPVSTTCVLPVEGPVDGLPPETEGGLVHEAALSKRVRYGRPPFTMLQAPHVLLAS